jgi:hypothetical protein
VAARAAAALAGDFAGHSLHVGLATAAARAGRSEQPMTIRLTPGAIDRLSEIERSLRRSGIRARRASASEIVEALVESADVDELRLQLKKKPT